jgi:putative SOS response-associated peptidase YedK
VCGRYTLAGPDPSSLRGRFGLGEQVVVRRRFNVAPTDDVVAVTTDREGTPRGDVLRWGLVPFWAEDPKIGARMINARAETVADKPAFRDALARRRCLILADGFYEWQRHDAGPKRAWWITRADGEPFAFAGLWATWRPRGADRDAVEPLRTCTILTTAANAVVGPLHDRMPVILPPGAEAAWLDHGTAARELHALLTPLDPELTSARRVGSAVNDARHDEPDCLDAPDAEDAGRVAQDSAPTLF